MVPDHRELSNSTGLSTALSLGNACSNRDLDFLLVFHFFVGHFKSISFTSPQAEGPRALVKIIRVHLAWAATRYTSTLFKSFSMSGLSTCWAHLIVDDVGHA